MKKIVGRDSNCDFVILDPQSRVSRRHVEVQKNEGNFYIKDLQSLNGTYVNGKKIMPDKIYKIAATDNVTLSIDYKIDVVKILSDSDSTRVFSKNAGGDQQTIFFENNKTIFNDGKKTVELDRDKTQLGDILEMDNTPFITIGRNPDNVKVINDNNISRYHCKIRMVTPVMIEFEDLGSTNGSFADNEKLIPNKKYRFSSSVKLRIGSSLFLNLKSLFPNIHILQKAAPTPKEQLSPNPVNNQIPSENEKAAFNELEAIWKEYQERHNQANNASLGYSIGGSVLGLAASILIPGGPILGALLAGGSGIMGRYLGQQKSSEIRNDLTYEDAFLQTYACPRCKESFMKKPWITIRDCFKCKVKYR